MRDLVQRHAELGQADLEWLHLLVGDWQLVSDLSFADLVLWVPDREGRSWFAVAHCRPSTGATVYYDDVVGHPGGARPPAAARPGLRPDADLPRARPGVARGRPGAGGDGADRARRARDRRALAAHEPGGRADAVPARADLHAVRGRPGPDDVDRRVPGDRGPDRARRGAPRVGDGLLRLDREGRIGYASPNALSALHRLGYVGDLVDHALSEIVTPLLDQPGTVDESLPLVLTGRAPWRSDIESRGDDAVAAGDPAHDLGGAAGGAGAAARRLRAATPRARADDQGRDDPRGAPPGEEQPADRGRAAAAAGPADPVRRGAAGAAGGDAPGGDDRARARDAVGRAGGDRRLRRRRRADAVAGRGAGGADVARCRCGGRASSARCGRRTRRRWRW